MHTHTLYYDTFKYRYIPNYGSARKINSMVMLEQAAKEREASCLANNYMCWIEHLSKQVSAKMSKTKEMQLGKVRSED